MHKRVLILLANGFEVMEAACFTKVFGWASIYGYTHFDQLSVGLRSPVRTTFGFDVLPEKLLHEINADDFDALVIPGGFGDAGFYEDALSELFLNVIRSFHMRQAPIAAVCVSAMSSAGMCCFMVPQPSPRSTASKAIWRKPPSSLSESQRSRFYSGPIILRQRHP